MQQTTTIFSEADDRKLEQQADELLRSAGALKPSTDPDIPQVFTERELMRNRRDDRRDQHIEGNRELMTIRGDSQGATYNALLHDIIDTATKHGCTPRQVDYLRLQANGLSIEAIAEATRGTWGKSKECIRLDLSRAKKCVKAYSTGIGEVLSDVFESGFQGAREDVMG